MSGLRNYTAHPRPTRTSGSAMQATAHFVFWTILLQTLIGFALA